MTRTLILVAIGGGAGSILRYLTTIAMNKWFPSLFPWGTFTVNVIGCLIVGVLIGLFERQTISNHELRLLLITGFCGGYTTFSAFSAENINLIQNSNLSIAMLYIAMSVLTSLVAVWFGLILVKGG